MMIRMASRKGTALLISLLFCVSYTWAQENSPATPNQAPQHNHPMQHPGTPSPADARTPVQLPGELKQHMLANMRDHMSALQEIITGIAHSEFDKVATIAEERLGVSSGKRHGAHQVAAYMPAGMSQIGGATHQAASRLALAAQDAGVTGDTKPVLAALAEVMIGCVACHGAYRLE